MARYDAEREEKRRSKGGAWFAALFAVLMTSFALNFVMVHRMSIAEYEDAAVRMMETRGLILAVVLRVPLDRVINAFVVKIKNVTASNSGLVPGNSLEPGTGLQPAQQHNTSSIGKQLARIMKAFVRALASLPRQLFKQKHAVAEDTSQRMPVGAALRAAFGFTMCDLMVVTILFLVGLIAAVAVGISDAMYYEVKPVIELAAEGRRELTIMSAFSHFYTQRYRRLAPLGACAMYMITVPFSILPYGTLLVHVMSTFVVVITATYLGGTVSAYIRAFRETSGH